MTLTPNQFKLLKVGNILQVPMKSSSWSDVWWGIKFKVIKIDAGGELRLELLDSLANDEHWKKGRQEWWHYTTGFNLIRQSKPKTVSWL